MPHSGVHYNSLERIAAKSQSGGKDQWKPQASELRKGDVQLQIPVQQNNENQANNCASNGRGKSDAVYSLEKVNEKPIQSHIQQQ